MFTNSMNADETKEMLHQLTLLKLMCNVPNVGQMKEIDLVAVYSKTFLSLKKALAAVGK